MLKIRILLAARARALLAAGLLVVTPGWLTAGQATVEPEAKQILQTSLAYLAGLQQFAAETHSTIEAVLTSGQKIQFDTAVAVAVKRPDKLYAVRLGDLVGQEFFYDGEDLTLHDLEAGYYATLPAPDTLEGMLDFARDSLDIVAPAGDLIYANAFELLMEDVETGFVVGTSFVAGAVCDHVAFSKPGTDFQVWVEQGDRPLPRKLVITSRDVMNAPQFTVHIEDWNLAPELAADDFRFVQPEAAQAIEFIIVDQGGN